MASDDESKDKKSPHTLSMRAQELRSRQFLINGKVVIKLPLGNIGAEGIPFLGLGLDILLEDMFTESILGNRVGLQLVNRLLEACRQDGDILICHLHIIHLEDILVN